VGVRIVGVVDFVADTPHEDGGVITVAEDHVAQVTFPPFFKKCRGSLESGGSHIPAFNPLLLWEFPFVEGFVKDQESLFIAQVVKEGGLGIVTGTDGIASQ